jgi:hypothetical protein
VQDVRWVKSNNQPADDYTYSSINGNDNHRLGTGAFIHKGIMSAVKRVEFISDRMSYITLRGSWCDIIVLNEDKSDATKDSFCWDLERALNQFPKNHMKIVL